LAVEAGQAASSAEPEESPGYRLLLRRRDLGPSRRLT
jgi:hypothetical protein